MAQIQNDVSRFAGPSMIQDFHHMAGIPLPQDEADRGGRQSEQQGRSDRHEQGSNDRVGNRFEYHNPRQYS